jgi:subtilisin family serine protease
MLSAQNKFYYYQGEQIPLTVSTEKILVKFSDSLTFKQKNQIITSNFSLQPVKKSENDTTSNVLIVELEKGKSVSQIEEITTQLNKNSKVVIANPIFLYNKDSTLQGITDEFVVKLKSPFDYSELERIAKETNTQIVKQNQFDPSIYTLSADKNAQGNALEMANYFYETKKFEFAEPNFLGLNIIHSNDPYYSDQWSLENTGQYSGLSGADMDVHDAWAITMGRDDIKVAVIDEGVDLVHPDLVDNILPGFDATGQGSNGAPTGDDAHGTACAGIIAAKANNGIGIAGVCPNCKILPVRSLPLGNSTATWLADGINWAWQNDADVISCSWHFSPSSLIDNAINNAITNGRSGLGCVVLFAAGNKIVL